MYSPSARSGSSGQQSVPAVSTEPPCDASCSSALGSSSAQAAAGGSSQGGAVASSPLERSQPEGTEDASGGCRRAEPTSKEGEEGQSQPARANQDSDDSDDDPILIPSTRFRGQGQRLANSILTVKAMKHLHVFECRLLCIKLQFCSCLISLLKGEYSDLGFL